VRFEVTADRSLVRLGSDGLAAVVRAFAVDPKGEYLQIGGANGSLVAYRIDPENGSLIETASEAGLGDLHATVIRYLE
jgi:6-phosphogluconolactonase (cycloisomerase 2 family)